MTGRATRQLADCPDFVLGHQFPAYFLLICRSFPIHVEDLILGTNIHFGVAVAIEAPLHIQRRGLEHQRHLVDGTVARRAANAFVDVYAVVEVNVISKTMDAYPSNRGIRAIAITDRFEVADVIEKHGVAIHTGLGRRDAGESGSFDTVMTVAAINAVIADVVFVTELQRLVSGDAFIGDVRRSRHKQNRRQRDVRQNHQCEHRKSRNQICAAVKDLGHVQFAPEGLFFKGPSISEERPLLCQTARVRVKVRPHSVYQISPDCNR